MSFDGGAAVGAGLIAGAAMSALLYVGIGVVPTRMRMNLFLMLGTMMFKNKGMAYIAGAMAHAVMSVGFGLVPPRNIRCQCETPHWPWRCSAWPKP